MTDMTIFLISLGVTLLGLVVSWGVHRRRGLASGLRGAAWSLVPLAAALTGVTEFLFDLATLSVTEGIGVGVAGLAVLLYLTSGVMLSRRAGAAERPAAGRGGEPKAAGGRTPRARGEVGAAGPAADPEMAEIEEILRNRGIT